MDADTTEVAPEARLKGPPRGGGQGPASTPHRADACLGRGRRLRGCSSAARLRLYQLIRRPGFQLILALRAQALNAACGESSRRRGRHSRRGVRHSHDHVGDVIGFSFVLIVGGADLEFGLDNRMRETGTA